MGRNSRIENFFIFQRQLFPCTCQESKIKATGHIESTIVNGVTNEKRTETIVDMNNRVTVLGETTMFVVKSVYNYNRLTE